MCWLALDESLCTQLHFRFVLFHMQYMREIFRAEIFSIRATISTPGGDSIELHMFN